jgi:hypothetical protein
METTTRPDRQRGAFLILAAVFVLIVLSFLGLVFLTTFTTSTSSSLNDIQSTQALFIAEGGLHYAAKLPSPNHGVGTAGARIPLGRGGFYTAVPLLSNNITSAVTSINVSSTDGFLAAPDASYWVVVPPSPGPSLPLTSVCEKMSFTTKTATSFSGGTRDQDATAAAAHNANAVVLSYAWDTAVTTLLDGNFNKNETINPICVDSVTGFDASGFIRLVDSISSTDTEDVFYTGLGLGSATCGGGCAACFTGYQRNAYNGGAPWPGNNHQQARTRVYQLDIGVITTATGVVAGNPLTGDIQRKVQGLLMVVL